MRRPKPSRPNCAKGTFAPGPGKNKLVETRKAVEDGWRSVANLLAKDVRHALANDVQRFIERMPAPKTEREWIAAELLNKAREQTYRESELVR